MVIHRVVIKIRISRINKMFNRCACWIVSAIIVNIVAIRISWGIDLVTTCLESIDILATSMLRFILSYLNILIRKQLRW